MINRRSFLKLAGAGLLSLLLPSIEIEAEMELADVWAKLANQARLTPEELDFLKMQGRETQQRNAFVAGNTSPSGGLIVPSFFTPIFSEKFTIDKGSFTVNIPQNYNHLIVVCSGRTTSTDVGSNVVSSQFNSDTGANYSVQDMYGIATTASAVAITGITALFSGSLQGGGAAAGISASTFGFISNYTSSFHKNIVIMEAGNNPTGKMVLVSAGYWASTEKIQTMNFAPTGTGTPLFATGSIISIYGIL